MDLKIKEEDGFKYIDEGEGQPIVLLHGLFGALSNWKSVVDTFSNNYNVLIPLLPIYENPLKKQGLEELVNHLEKFVALKSLSKVILIGNSLGGHVGLIYTIVNQSNVDKLVLAGSSGLYENTMGGSFPKRSTYEYIKERIEHTFYNPKTATKELVDEIFAVTKNIPKCLRIVAMARSAQRHNMAKELHKIKVPTLLIWGLNDTITPAIVGHEFNKLISSSELRFIDKCCHAPMMECKKEFNTILNTYLSNH